jgi:hypothetical protein
MKPVAKRKFRMADLSTEYLEFLSELQGAPLKNVIYQHQAFWMRNAAVLRHELTKLKELNGVIAYHAGTVPIKGDLASDPETGLKRVGLYADALVFDDIVGNILAKLPNIPKEYYNIVSDQTQTAIATLSLLKKWTRDGIVKILPSDKVLRQIYGDQAFQLLSAVSLEQAAGDLPGIIKNILSPEQRKALSTSAGQALIYKVNKAQFLKEKLDLLPSADDTFFDVYCEVKKWDHTVLEDIANIHVIKKVKQKYLCDSAELVFFLREKDCLAGMRKFFREQIKQFRGDDIRKLRSQESIDEFSRELKDKIEEGNAELEGLKRKLRSEISANLTLAGGMLALAFCIDSAGNFAAWIPQLVGSLPSVHAGQSILEAIKNYVINSAEIKTKPTFILGSQLEKAQ